MGNRLSHSMDGGSGGRPPDTPRYGDARWPIVEPNGNEVEDWKREMKIREEALKRARERLNREISGQKDHSIVVTHKNEDKSVSESEEERNKEVKFRNNFEKENEKEDNEELNKEGKDTIVEKELKTVNKYEREEKEEIERKRSGNEDEERNEPIEKGKGMIIESKRAATYKREEKEEKDKEELNQEESGITEEKFKEEGNPVPKLILSTVQSSFLSSPSPPPSPSSSECSIPTMRRRLVEKYDPLLLDERHQEDLRALTRYDEDYASIHPNGVLVNSNGNIHDVKGNIVTDDPDKSSEEDASRIMLGASVRGMSKGEKEAEKLRWENEVLGKVPEQPSFNELGMENQIFELDTRRSKANAIAAAAAVVAATTARR